jgi:hypothetical protein
MNVITNAEMDRRIAELAQNHRAEHVDPTVRVTNVDPA